MYSAEQEPTGLTIESISAITEFYTANSGLTLEDLCTLAEQEGIPQFELFFASLTVPENEPIPDTKFYELVELHEN